VPPNRLVVTAGRIGRIAALSRSLESTHTYTMSKKSSLFKQLLQASDHPQQLALATVNGQRRGLAFNRADEAYERGEPPSYRPDWQTEQEVLAATLDPYTKEDAPTTRQMSEYKEEWVRRFEAAHERGHTDF